MAQWLGAIPIRRHDRQQRESEAKETCIARFWNTRGAGTARAPSTPQCSNGTHVFATARRQGGMKAPRADQLSAQMSKQRLLRDSLRANEPRDLAFSRMILSIPPGQVSTYGAVAAAAGYPRYHRAVAKLLRTMPADHLPWHRVLGVGGAIKLRDAAAAEQQARLQMEGVTFRGSRVDMERHQHHFRPWEVYG
jgi:methylated-DNA-protein-cysteine methyltransferase related protein